MLGILFVLDFLSLLLSPKVAFRIPYLVYFTAGIFLLNVLVLFQRKRLPFPYAVKLSKRGHLIWTVLPFLIAYGISDVVGLASNMASNPYIALLSLLLGLSSFPWALISSLTEESFKIVMINGLALGLGRIQSWRGLRKARIWVAGLTTVFFWTVLHIPFMQYGLPTLTTTFLTGVVIFYVVYKKRNMFPAVYIHFLWNFLLVFFT